MLSKVLVTKEVEGEVSTVPMVVPTLLPVNHHAAHLRIITQLLRVTEVLVAIQAILRCLIRIRTLRRLVYTGME